MKTNNDISAARFGQKLRKTRKNLVDSFNKETTHLKENHKKKVNLHKLNAHKELLDLHDQSQLDANELISQNQKKLSNHRTLLKDESQRLNKELDLISNVQKNKMTDMNMRFDDKYKEQYLDALNKSENIFEKNQNEIAKLEENSNLEIARHKFKTKIKANNNSRKNDRAINKQNENYSLLQSSQKELNRREIELQKIDHLKKLANQNFFNENERTEKNIIHQNQLKEINEKQKLSLKQERESFKRKFEILQKNHQIILDRVNNKFNEEANLAVSKNASVKLNASAKQDDPFYRLTKLEPQVIEKEKEYIVTLKVPSFESENIRLSAQDRKLTIALTREYKDDNHDDKGNYHSTKRSEVLYRNLETKDLMDSQKISQEYKDGSLIFTIAKK